MSGYWNDPVKTDSAFVRDKEGNLWYKTGDLVRLDSEGQLIYIRRKDRMIKRRGYRIELDEIENHLRKNKNVFEVAVTASSADSQTDNVITAHVVWNQGSVASSNELIEHCNAALASYMLPDRFVFHASLPKTSTNKINYVALTKA
jgi:acyl-coenzyme A synthetase/AMP-(fatty) acid ligase